MDKLIDFYNSKVGSFLQKQEFFIFCKFIL